jgi:hypothetical protein
MVRKIDPDDIFGDRRETKIWWMLATALLYELGREITPDMDVLNAILDGEIQLFERAPRVKGTMPSFKAVTRGEEQFVDANVPVPTLGSEHVQ